MDQETIPDQFITVGKLKTRYWQIGDHGSPLLLIHGIGVAMEWYSENIATLAQQHRLYLVDLPGHGRTDKPQAPYTLDYYAEFVEQFMQTIGLEQAAVLGHSLGGGVALRLALSYPQRVHKLILMASAALGKEIAFPFRLATLPWIGEVLTRPNAFNANTTLQSVFYDPAKIPAHFRDVLLGYGKEPGAHAAILVTLRAGVNVWGVRDQVLASTVEQLGAIHCPTLILWGKQDAIFPANQGEQAQHAIPHAHLHLFEECGHNPQVEQRDEFHRQVLTFLAAS